MKKRPFIINLVLMLILLFSFPSLNIISEENFNLKLQIDFEKYLKEIASKNDTIINAAFYECSQFSKNESYRYVDELSNVLSKQNIPMAEYFKKQGVSNEVIVNSINNEIQLLLDKTIETLKKRLNAYKFKSYTIKQIGTNSIDIKIDGVTDKEAITKLLVSEGKLEFNIVLPQNSVFNLLKSMDSIYAGANYLPINSMSEIKQINDSAVFQNSHPLLYLFHHFFYKDTVTDWFLSEKNSVEFIRIINTEEVSRIIPDTVKFLFSKDKFIEEKYKNQLFAVKKVPELSGDVILKASARMDTEKNVVYVRIKMNSLGAKKFEEITGKYVKSRLAIVIDDLIYSAPVIIEKISGGKIELAGLSSINEAKMYAAIFNSGELPLPIKKVVE